MDLCFKNRLLAGATTISNNFIDHYMAGASGEYVKVYLYLLRHQEEIVTVEAVADALDHTEADVRRALAYWQRAGVLGQAEAVAEEAEKDGAVSAGTSDMAGERTAGEMPDKKASGQGMSAGELSSRGLSAGETTSRGASVREISGRGALVSQGVGYTAAQPLSLRKGEEASARELPARETEDRQAAVRETSVSCDMTRLADDESFRQLTYIAEQYLGRILTQTDCQILGYLYVNLQMAPELLEYLIEYCVQNHHTSLRYMEKVALSWHERKIRTVEEAKAYAQNFSKETFAVMKAMGLNGRNPAESEFRLMEKWFREYGFTREIVVEACSRTIQAIHKPSFQYADRILSDWKKAGVRAFRDVAALDKQRKEKSDEEKKEQAGAQNRNQGQGRRGGRTVNRFHNLEEHGYDYDEMVWNMIGFGSDTGGADGTQ